MTFRLILLLTIVFYCQVQVFAQKKHQITGTLTDAESQPMIAATVVLLQLPDSTFADYGLSGDDGTFRLSGTKNGTFVLQISYMGFDPYIQPITLDKDYALGIIKMEESTNMLEVAQIEAEYIPIQMKGDTLEFNSAAFNVQAHDDVEKLLEQMPGVEIEEDGTIKINGKKVEKILVDGKEFFGEDIKAALKNLPADAIKKIEVFDKKTDKEEITGTDSKDKNKTINLTLKEDKKVGFMGNVEGGYGYPNHRYKGALSLSYFNPKMRISLIGATNNINQAGFSYQDYQGMSGGYDDFMAKHPAMSLGSSWNDPVLSLLWGGSTGVTRTIAGGVNGNFFFTENTELSVNYMYTNADRTEQNQSFIRSITPANFYTSNSTSDKLLLAQRHVINTKFTHKFDTTQEIRVRIKMNINNSKDNLIKLGETLGENDSLTNKLNQESYTDENGLGVIGNIYYQKKLQKKGRSFSANTALAYVNGQNVFENNSYTSIYNNAAVTGIDTLNQQQAAANGKLVYGAEVSYTEPVGEGNLLDFKLTGGFSNESNDRKAIDLVEQAEVVNNNLTDIYQKHYNFQQFSIQFKRNVEKYDFSVSAELKRSALQGVLASNSTPINQEYYYPIAGLGFEYKFTESKKLSIYYNTSVNEPQLDQLQPMLNNQNPLSIRLGNPNLIPEYQHSVWMSYNLWDQKTFTSGYFQAYFNMTQNSIIQSQTIDEFFRTVYVPINFGQSYSGGMYFGYNFEIKKILKLNVGGGANIYQSPVLINNIKSEQIGHNYNARIGVGNKDKKVFDVHVSANVQIGNSIYSNNESLNLTNISHRYTAKARVTIAKKWNIASEFKYQVYENIGYKNTLAVPLWSASINRTFFKDDALKIELSAENLLNEPFLVNRYNWGGNVTESKTNTLGRYFMLTVAYKINKMGGKTPTVD